jgi:hypothetical protein
MRKLRGGVERKLAWERYELAQDGLILTVSDTHWEEIKDPKPRIFSIVSAILE